MGPKFFLTKISRAREASDKSRGVNQDLFAPSGATALRLIGAAAWWNTCGATNLSGRLMGTTLRDRTGERYGRLTVIKRGPNQGKATTRWWCECDCGQVCVLVASCNLGRSTLSCGCQRAASLAARKGSKRLQQPTQGTGFGRWVVIGPANDIGYPNATCTGGFYYEPAVLVRCSCKAKTERVVLVKSLLRGISNSCGCLKEFNNLRHGKARKHTRSTAYTRYMGMLARCRNPSSLSWPDYGGRGIEVCERWLAGFEFFLEDMGEPPGPGYQIDRQDNNAGYSPENCRWVTASQNSRNRRNTVVVVDVGAQSIGLLEASEMLGLRYQYVWKLNRAGRLRQRLLAVLEASNEC